MPPFSRKLAGQFSQADDDDNSRGNEYPKNNEGKCIQRPESNVHCEKFP
jgi:hypothetical protein